MKLSDLETMLMDAYQRGWDDRTTKLQTDPSGVTIDESDATIRQRRVHESLLKYMQLVDV